MKILIAVLTITQSLWAQETPAKTVSSEDSLRQSYQREYVYLVSQKEALLRQKNQLKKSYAQRIAEGKQKTKSLQKSLVSLTTQNDENHEMLMDLEKRKKEMQRRGSSLESTYKKSHQSVEDFQAGLRFQAPMKKTETLVPENLKFADFQSVMNQTLRNLENSAEKEVYAGAFLNSEDQLQEGQITRLGRSAAIGSVNGQHFVLGPNGEGQLKALEPVENPEASSLALYLFESVQKAAKVQKAGGIMEKLADWSPLFFLSLMLFLVAGLFASLIKV